MNSLLNIALFFVAIALLCVAFVAVNIYMDKWSLRDFSENLASLVDFKKDSSELPQKQDSWASLFSKREVPHYRYPTPELFIALDFSGKNRTDILKISNLDSYKFFCLKEILKSNNIQFTYKIQNQKAMLEIVLDSAQKRANLLSELKRYNIAYQISAS